MVIDKILNNNVVIIKNSKNVEKVIMGRGIGFQKKVGEPVDKSKIEKIFTITDEKTANRLQELLVEIPLEYITLTEEIITYGKTYLGKKLNDIIYVSLVDHIYNAVERHLEGIAIKNTLLWEIKRFYPYEYEVGKEALKMIEKRLEVSLSEDEARFIAMHFVNAEMDNSNMEDMYQITKVMQEITNIVKFKFQIQFNEDSVYYYRFITHLKFFAQRLVTRTSYQDIEDNDLLDIVKIRYKNAYQCVLQIEKFIQKTYHYNLSNEEKLYLTIHIERVVYKANN